MRYRLINVIGDSLYISDKIYHEDSIEASKHIHQFKTSDDGVEYYNYNDPGVRSQILHPGVRFSFYIPEPHPLFNASLAGDLSFNKGRGFVVISDIALNQLSSYLNK